MTPTVVLFWAFAGIALVSAALCISRQSPLASALWLVVTLFALSAIYVALDAQFIGVLQVLVYAGAIMVLFLFVIMLLNLARSGPSDIKGPWGLVVAAVLVGFLYLPLRVLPRAGPPEVIRLPAGTMAALQEQQGMVQSVGRPLLSDYLIPFEITSVLLLAAVVGAVVLAKRKL